MAKVTLRLPGLLRDVAGTTMLKLEAKTLAAALEEAYARVPALRAHLCLDGGGFRPHVLCYLNDTNTRGMKSLDLPIEDGDEISIVQAISGG